MKKLTLILCLLLLPTLLYAGGGMMLGIVGGGTPAAAPPSCETLEIEYSGSTNLALISLNQYSTYTHRMTHYTPAAGFTLCKAQVEMASHDATPDAVTITFVVMPDHATEDEPDETSPCECSGTINGNTLTTTPAYVEFTGCNCACNDTTNGCWFGVKHDGQDTHYVDIRVATGGEASIVDHHFFYTTTSVWYDDGNAAIRVGLYK
jgi:hypothetical protein